LLVVPWCLLRFHLSDKALKALRGAEREPGEGWGQKYNEEENSLG
jgi:hypothetical protein